MDKPVVKYITYASVEPDGSVREYTITVERPMDDEPEGTRTYGSRGSTRTVKYERP